MACSGCPASPASTPRPNVVLVVLDTTRADAVSAYGAPLGTTPATAALARSGLQYDRAYANANWTLPSHGTLFTGLLPKSHGLDAGKNVLRDVPTLADTLGGAGYETVALVENVWLKKGCGLERGFDTYATSRSRSTVQSVERWFSKRDRTRPFFLFVNLMDAHSPYLVRTTNPFLPEGFSTADAQALDQKVTNFICNCSRDDESVRLLHGLYLGNVHAADEKLGAILQVLESARSSAPLIVVVTSDHGEQFGENRLIEHHVGVGNGLLHVPLIVNGLPRVEPTRIESPVQLADLMPSILQWTNVPAPAGLIGKPLPLHDAPDAAPRLLVATTIDPVAALQDMPKLVFDAAMSQFQHCGESDRIHGEMRSITRFPYKLRWYEKYPTQLFDLSTDPYEEHDLAGEMPDLVAELSKQLDTIVTQTTPSGSSQTRDLEPAEIERLRALGYLGGDAVAEPTANAAHEP